VGVSHLWGEAGGSGEVERLGMKDVTWKQKGLVEFKNCYSILWSHCESFLKKVV
jgi:hypothetical protein